MPWPRNRFETNAAIAPVATPARRPSATPATTAIDCHRLDAGQRGEEHPPGGGCRTERRDDRQLARRVRTRLEPRDAGRDERRRPEQRGEGTVTGCEGCDEQAGRNDEEVTHGHPLGDCRLTTRSATSAAHGRSWVTTSVPRRGASERRSAASSAFRSGSTPRVGSSSTSRSGSVASTAASASRSRSPTERSRGCRAACSVSPSFASAARARVWSEPSATSSTRVLRDEVASGVLRQERQRAHARLDLRRGRAAPRRSARASSCRRRSGRSARRSRPGAPRATLRRAPTGAVGEANVAHRADELRRMRQVERPVLGEPRERLVARRVERDAAVAP